ncbi:T cell receptor alpha chain MC.7.G5-like [Falco biarmicus]|uniref:T cell receptor alpha chain MC.7.G5-like n=1 Tax=Falco cherrug TaxID=345164 RepID=UPI002478A994|nr:T cell receptor alpha chain MC.7.G5-like [Falco cherrug]XP_056218654.1 T cell receptor alpha chain MC.7.G5-like [Falco biarmicus]
MRRGRGWWLTALAAVLLVAAARAQVHQKPSAETTEGTSISLSCSHPSIKSYDFIYWYRQLPGQSPTYIASGSEGTSLVQDPPGRLSVAADRRSSSLWLTRPQLRDAAVYYCAVGETRGAVGLGDKLVFGSGTTLTVEQNNREPSVPQVIMLKSKKLEDSTGKAACLARNFSPKNISLEMSPNEVVYEQSTSILTSEGLYDAIKVVSMANGTEVTCTAKFYGRTITPEKEADEPGTGKVCNTADTLAPDTKVEKANTLSVAVLGLRVLLAKSIALNTLMTIKLFLF